MLNNLKQFLKHTLIYSISNVAAKAVGFVLIPLYTAYISIDEFGQFSLIDATIMILVEILPLGLANAILIINNNQEYSDKKSSGFFTIISFILLLNFVFVILFELLYATGLLITLLGEENQLLLRISLWIIIIRVINSLFLTKLRADEKSVIYTAASVVKLLFTLGFAAYFIVIHKMGIIGILYAYLISEVVAFIIMLPLMIPQMKINFDKSILKFSLRFGFPFVFSSIGIMLLNLSDRYVLKLLTDNATIGLYDLGYRFAGILNMFLILPFSITLLPVAYKIYGQEGDKRYYTKLMTYLTFVLMWAGLALSIFSKEIIENFTFNPEYYPAYQVVPVVILSYIFSGMRNMAQLGMLLSKNTQYVAYTTLFVALLNIVLNFIFIPVGGMMAAAYNTLVSFIVYYFLSLIISNKYYHIPFEHKKLLLLFVIGIGFYFIAVVLSGINIILLFIIKVFLLLVFPVLLYYLNFYEKVEVSSLTGIYRNLISQVSSFRKFPAKNNENINSHNETDKEK